MALHALRKMVGKSSLDELFFSCFAHKIVEAVEKTFDLRPGAIIRDLDLRRPIYEKTAAYGHFGREDADFTWEKTDRVEELKAACGL